MHNDEDAARKISEGLCPDCGYRGFILGPRGGAAMNIECGSLECRSRWNVTQISGEVVFCHRIPREREGGAKWGAGVGAKFAGMLPGFSWP
jgi:hypothetical protein